MGKLGDIESHGEPLKKILNIPNFITTVRGVVGLCASYLCAMHGASPAIGGLMAGACLTDGIDGFIARRYDLKTKFGEKLDPSVDAACFISAMGALAYSSQGVERILFGVFLVTQFIYSGHMLHLGKSLQEKHGGKEWVPTTYVGKTKTAVVMTSMVILMSSDHLLQSTIHMLNQMIDAGFSMGDVKSWDVLLQKIGIGGVSAGWTATLWCWHDYNKKAKALLNKPYDNQE